MMYESPRQLIPHFPMSLRMFLLHLPFQPRWMCRTHTISRTCSELSIRRTLQCLSGQGNHTDLWEVRCLRRYARCVCEVQICALPLTHDVDHGLNGMCVNSCFIFSDSDGSHGTGIGSAPASTGILSSCTGSFNNWLDDGVRYMGFLKICSPSACTHEFCARTHDFGNSLARTDEFCESSARTRHFCESPARTHDSIVPLTFVNDLRLDEVHTIFLDQVFPSAAVLQKRFSREVCFSPVFAQATVTHDRLCHLHLMEVILSQVVPDLQPDMALYVLLECSSVRTSELN